MKQKKSGWKILGRDFSTSQLSVYSVVIIAIIVGLVGFFNDSVKFMISAVGALLVALTWFVVEKWEHSLDRRKLETLKKPDNIFERGKYTLEQGCKHGGWEKVLIYAPVGLWDPSPLKTHWLEALADALINKKVDYFGAVFALPPDAHSYYTYAKERLKLFSSTDNTEIHYLPPEDETHPTAAAGLGAIIFKGREPEKDEIIFAFVGQDTGGPLDRNALLVWDEEASNMITQWFEKQMLGRQSKDYVLRGRSPKGPGPVDFNAVLAEIEQKYYSSQRQAA
jgi:hypothetical protein